MKLNRMVWAAVAVLALQGFATATRASDPDEIVRRLDALEKENAALRQRLNRIEHAATTSKRAATPVARAGEIPRKRLNWKHPAMRRYSWTPARKATALPIATKTKSPASAPGTLRPTLRSAVRCCSCNPAPAIWNMGRW